MTGFIMTLGVKDFKFYEPWNDKYFKKASTKRGRSFIRNIVLNAMAFPAKAMVRQLWTLNPNLLSMPKWL